MIRDTGTKKGLLQIVTKYGGRLLAVPVALLGRAEYMTTATEAKAKAEAAAVLLQHTDTGRGRAVAFVVCCICAAFVLCLSFIIRRLLPVGSVARPLGSVADGRRLCACWLCGSASRLCCRWPPPVPPVGSVARLSASVPMAAASVACGLWLGLSALLPMAAASVACGLWLGLSASVPMAAASVPVGSVARLSASVPMPPPLCLLALWRATYGGEKKVHHFLWDCCTLTFQGGHGNCDLWGFSALWAAIVVPMGVVYADKKIHNTNRQVGLRNNHPPPKVDRFYNLLGVRDKRTARRESYRGR